MEGPDLEDTCNYVNIKQLQALTHAGCHWSRSRIFEVTELYAISQNNFSLPNHRRHLILYR